ncbi:MAG: flagellar biosynthetic protein FliO [Acidobacteria bacterium]|nr:MAG: flagellar biosynthetic protein FliO [Acidobacteriota bacterium]
MNCFLIILLTVSVQNNDQEPVQRTVYQTEETSRVEGSPEAGPKKSKNDLPAYQFPTVQPGVGATSIVKVFGSLALVLGLIGLLAYGAKRWLPTGFKAGDGSNHFKFIQNFPLGQRKYLALVEVDGRKMLLGITDQQISLIKSFEEFPFEETLANSNNMKTVSELLDETRKESVS